MLLFDARATLLEISLFETIKFIIIKGVAPLYLFVCNPCLPLVFTNLCDFYFENRLLFQLLARQTLFIMPLTAPGMSS
jgi:hypothetical protein